MRSSGDEGDSTSAAVEGRFIETSATSAEALEDSAEQKGPLSEEGGLQSSLSEGEPSLEGKSVWQRLKSIGRQQKDVSMLPRPFGLKILKHPEFF